MVMHIFRIFNIWLFVHHNARYCDTVSNWNSLIDVFDQLLLIKVNCIFRHSRCFPCKSQKPHHKSLTIYKIFKYDHVVPILGEELNTITVIFIASIDGVCSFTWTYMNKKWTTCYIGGIVVNSSGLPFMTQTATWLSSTAHLVFQMKKKPNSGT